jgi:hypothetical protein
MKRNFIWIYLLLFEQVPVVEFVITSPFGKHPQHLHIGFFQGQYLMLKTLPFGQHLRMKKRNVDEISGRENFYQLNNEQQLDHLDRILLLFYVLVR